MTDPKFALGTSAFAVRAAEAHDPFWHPYLRVAATDEPRTSGRETDLRKVSAWMRMIRELTEARNRRRG